MDLFDDCTLYVLVDFSAHVYPGQTTPNCLGPRYKRDKCLRLALRVDLLLLNACGICLIFSPWIS